MFAFVHWQGWLVGLVLYAVGVNVVALLLKTTMNLEMMGGMDEIFFRDDSRNCSNIVCYHKYERFDYKKVAHAMVSRALIFPRHFPR